MKTYLKSAFVPFVYLFLVSVIAFAILAIGDELVWLKAVLCVCNIGLYAVVVFGTSYKEGMEALKVRVANDTERRHIIKTGEDRPLRLAEEYKWWKGFLMGAIACAPMLILMLVHTVLILINPALNGAGVIACTFYMAFFSFMVLRNGNSTDLKPLEPTKFYFNLISLPIVMLICGFGYMMGARKIQRQQEVIRARHREIHGEEL